MLLLCAILRKTIDCKSGTYIRNVLFYKTTLNSGNSSKLFTKPFHIAVPSVQIVGDREVHVKAGTSVTLKCLISNCLEEPAYVFWYHGDRRLLDDDDQIPGKIKIHNFR